VKWWQVGKGRGTWISALQNPIVLTSVCEDVFQGLSIITVGFHSPTVAVQHPNSSPGHHASWREITPTSPSTQLLSQYATVWGEEWTAMKCHSTQAPLGRAGTLRKASGQAEDPARLCKGKKHNPRRDLHLRPGGGTHSSHNSYSYTCKLWTLKYLPLAYNSHMYT